MSFIEINGKRHPIPPGESAIGSDSNGFIALQGESIASRHLLIQGTADGQAAVRRADDSAEILINGVRLGPQPTPLLHGDKIEIGGYELLFVDERRSGSTQFVSAEELAKYQPLGAKRPQGAGGATNGRLVSLTDGREYTIIGSPLVLGREAGCDVVVTSKRVSRRHAEIVATPKGYLLRDTSTNGTFVNSERIDGERVLRRADVVRVGDDEFRFYVDAAAEGLESSEREDAVGAPGGDETPQAEAVQGVPTSVPAAPAEAVPPPATPPMGAEFRLGNTMHGIPTSQPNPVSPSSSEDVVQTPPESPPIGAEFRLGNTMHGIPSVPRPGAGGASPEGAEFRLGNTMHGIPGVAPGTPAPPPPTLAHLVGRSGDFKGRRFEIRVPVINVGRANYNDVVLADATVSTIHAKLQRREGIWVLADLDSTNGTFIDGERVSGEAPIAPGAIIRFGDVSTVFEPTDDGIDPVAGSSTRRVDSIDIPDGPPGGASPSGGLGSMGSKDSPQSEEEAPGPASKSDQGRSGFRLWPFK